MFAENLARLQQEKGVTNYRIAKDLHIHPTSVANWKNGKLPRMEHFFKLAKYFGVKPDELLK